MTVPAIAVLGGGVSGLAAAHRLQELSRQHQKPLRILVLEAGSRFGGIIATEKRDGFLIEKGPDAFLREKPWATELAARLGLENELISTRESARQSFIARGKRLVGVPKGFYLIAPLDPLPFLFSPLFTPWGKLRMLSEPWVPAKKDDQDESIADFVRRRFGQECLRRAGQPMLAGIYTGDPEELSISATLGRFRRLEKEHGSLLRGLKNERSAKAASGPRYGLFASFRGGMQVLTDALQSALSGQELRAGAAVRSVARDTGTRKWTLRLQNGEVLEVDAVCSTLPPRAAKEVFQEGFPEIARLFQLVHHESAATISFAYEDRQFSRLPKGAGFVVPSSERSAVIACTFADQKFEGRAPAGKRLLRAFAGGAFGRSYLKLDDVSLQETVQHDLERFLGIKGSPLFASFQRHSGAMIQYGLGHEGRAAKLRALAEARPGLTLAGPAFSGVGIPDCVHEAEAQAERSFEHLCRLETA